MAINLLVCMFVCLDGSQPTDRSMYSPTCIHIYQNRAREPYREVAKEIEEAMEDTIETINAQFSHDGKLLATTMPELPIHSTSQILDKLLLMHRCVRPAPCVLGFIYYIIDACTRLTPCMRVGFIHLRACPGGILCGRLSPCPSPLYYYIHAYIHPPTSSLVETGQGLIADGLLTDTIRRLKCFGVTLLSLDIRQACCPHRYRLHAPGFTHLCFVSNPNHHGPARVHALGPARVHALTYTTPSHTNTTQESTVHTETLDAITRYLGLGSYAQWDEETRMSWLNTELTAKRPLLQHVRFSFVLFLSRSACACVHEPRLAHTPSNRQPSTDSRSR